MGIGGSVWQKLKMPLAESSGFSPKNKQTKEKKLLHLKVEPEKAQILTQEECVAFPAGVNLHSRVTKTWPTVQGPQRRD